jgi:ATP:corrinoid adenosyltransferase
VVEAADYVSYTGSVKHPFRRGLDARVGVEH